MQKVELLCSAAVSLAYRTVTVTPWDGGEIDKKAKVKRPGQRQSSTT